MIRRLSTLALLAIVLPLALGFTPGWSYFLTPNPPMAGDVLKVHVIEAPATPVRVQIFVDGVLLSDTSLTTLPAAGSAAIPGNSSGKPFEIRMSCTGSQTSTTGAVG